MDDRKAESRVWLQTELDDTKSRYQLIITISITRMIPEPIRLFLVIFPF